MIMLESSSEMPLSSLFAFLVGTFYPPHSNMISNMYNSVNDSTNFVTDGIYLTESLLLTDSASGVFGLTTNVFIDEAISLTDSISNLDNSDFPTIWNKKVLEIDASKVSADLNHVPVLVKLTDDPDLSTTSVGSSGQGIRFTSDGSTLIDFEIESYSIPFANFFS